MRVPVVRTSFVNVRFVVREEACIIFDFPKTIMGPENVRAYKYNLIGALQNINIYRALWVAGRGADRCFRKSGLKL